jgi:hypothetical protein
MITPAFIRAAALAVTLSAFAPPCGQHDALALDTARAVTLARDSGQWGDTPDNVRAWFKSVRSPSGVPCCDIADGHRTDYDVRRGPGGDGYWIPIPDTPPSRENWMQVPPEAVVYDAGNPVGEAIVWYVRNDHTSPNGGGGIYIRCFVPGGGV